MFRQLILAALAGAILTASATAALAAEASKPNIVYILADDFGYGDAKCYNPESKIATPHIDRLAGEGMRFTDAHSGSAVCSPTRYGILTGRYAWRTNLRRGVLQPYDPPLIAADRLTVPKLLKQHGYHTACIGKWHLGWDWPKSGGEVVFDQPIAGGPTARGFEYYFGTHVPNHPPYCFIENDRTVGQPTAMKEVRDLNGRPGPMLPGWRFDAILPTLAERAVQYIGKRAKSDQPFFLYLPLTSPHEPIAPSERFRGKSGISDLADFMLETDWAVGEVLAALDKHKLSENTLVIFTCDNGHSSYTGLPALKEAGHSVSGPLRGLKGDIWEGGHRVPFIVRWPGHVLPGATCPQTICHTNLLATCAEIVKAKLPADAGEDSTSIAPLFAGETTEPASFPAVVHQASNGTLGIRRGNLKLVLGSPATAERPAAPDQLFDLASDLAETKNIAADQPRVAGELAAHLQKLIDDGRSTPGPAQKNDVAVPLRIALPANATKKKN
jgi:arylsulfatase A-like enzyme